MPSRSVKHLALAVLMTLLILVPAAEWSSAARPGRPAEADPQQPTPPSQLDEIVDTGILIVDNRYVPAPYHVLAGPEVLTVNGILVPHRHSDMADIDAEDLPYEEFGFRRRWRRRQTPGNMGARLVDCLSADGLVVVFETGRPLRVPFPESVQFLQTLLDPQLDDHDRLGLLEECSLDLYGDWSTRLAHLVTNLQIDAALLERLDTLNLVYRDWTEHMEAKAEASRKRASRGKLLDRVMLPLGLIVSALAVTLLVKARGALLPQSPDEADWKHLDDTGRRPRRVMHLLGLLVLLNALDLTCTLLAIDAGQFTELNPLAGMLVHSDLGLAGFKIAAVALGATLLIKLRRYRGAEVATWWLCLAYTLLTIRWASQGTLVQI